MKEYSFVFIDADDTLFDYKAAEEFALSRALLEFGIKNSTVIQEAYSQINKELWLDYEQSRIGQNELRTERFRRLFHKIKVEIDDYHFSDIYLSYLSEASFLIHDAENICHYLKSKYTLAIITNGISTVQRNRLKKSKINKYIDFLVISEEAKYSKPNIEIFKYAEAITNYREKEKMIIIGDSLSSDIQGGLNYGIDTCWLNREKRNNESKIEPMYIVESLVELKNIL